MLKKIQTQILDYVDFLMKKYREKFNKSPQENKKSNFGSAKGLIVMSNDFDLPLDDFKDYR